VQGRRYSLGSGNVSSVRILAAEYFHYKQDISESDAVAEGAVTLGGQYDCPTWEDQPYEGKYHGCCYPSEKGRQCNAICHFYYLWESTVRYGYKEGSHVCKGGVPWCRNPFVWVYEFMRVEQP
jgi:hypothetical protein